MSKLPKSPQFGVSKPNSCCKCVLVLVPKLEVEEVELVEDTIDGSNTMKENLDSRENWENPRKMRFFYYHTLINTLQDLNIYIYIYIYALL